MWTKILKTKSYFPKFVFNKELNTPSGQDGYKVYVVWRYSNHGAKLETLCMLKVKIQVGNY